MVSSPKPLVALVWALSWLCCGPSLASPTFDIAHGGGLHEEASRFLPGAYFFHKGCEYQKRGEMTAAIDAWLISASWAMKDAQYNLGIVYFKGLGVATDRPKGIAWLALSAERGMPAFESSLAAAWQEASDAEREAANATWRELKPRYGDTATLGRARARFVNELNSITGSRVGMPGAVKVWTAATGQVDGAVFRERMQELAEVNFGAEPQGTVQVGPLQYPANPDDSRK
jgi:hypothetical protein